MKAFVIELENRPGELARVTEAIAAKGINLTSGAGIGWGTNGAFVALTNDEAGTRNTLKGICSFREVDVIPTTVSDEPGTLSKVARKLANAGVNIEFVVPTSIAGGKDTIAIGVDNVEAARAALGQPMVATA
jgi:hypothetical protein